MQSTAQGWLALELTNDPFLVTVVYASSSLPVAILTLYGGVVADRRDRLRLVTVAQACLLAQAVLLWWLAWSGHVTIGWLIGLALASGIVNAFEIPARQSLLIELVGREDLIDAIALNSSGFNLARIIGPAVGGLVIARAGLAAAFGANAVSYLAVLAGLLMIRLPPRTVSAPQGSPFAVLREGLGYIRRTPEVWALLRLVAVYAVCGAPYLALMPVIARETLRGGASTYGWLLGAVGTGAILAALALALLSSRTSRGQLLRYGALAFPILLIAFSFSRSFALSAALLVAVGFSMIVTNAVANGLLQTTTPDALRGRVMAAYSWVFVGVGPVIGPYVAGAVAKHAGAPVAVGIGAAITLAYGTWAFAARPELRSL